MGAITEFARVYEIPADEVPSFAERMVANGFRIYPGLRLQMIGHSSFGTLPGELETWHGGRRLYIYAGEKGKPLQDFIDKYVAQQREPVVRRDHPFDLRGIGDGPD